MIRPAIDFIRKTSDGKQLIGCEVGVYNGNHASSILDCVNMEMLYLVDFWRTYKQGRKTHVIGDRDCLEVYRRFHGFDNVSIVRLSSKIASQMFVDRFFDFVYIDASHQYEDVKADLDAWWPKVKTCGVLGGHDYNFKWPGVTKAVSEICEENQLEVCGPSVCKMAESHIASDWWIVKGGERR